jgi:hypothetical protein
MKSDDDMVLSVVKDQLIHFITKKVNEKKMQRSIGMVENPQGASSYLGFVN